LSFRSIYCLGSTFVASFIVDIEIGIKMLIWACAVLPLLSACCVSPVPIASKKYDDYCTCVKVVGNVVVD
jgi:hypothetical protein